MTELMEEDDDREYKQKGNDVTNKPMAQRIETMQKKLGHWIPLSQSRKPCPPSSRMPLRLFEARGWRPYFARYGQRQWHRRRSPTAQDCRSGPSRSSWPRPAARSRRI